MIRRIRFAGAGLLVLSVCAGVATVAIQLNSGLAQSIASNSTCNYEPCTAEQLQSLSLVAGPVTALVLAGFGLALLKARIIDRTVQGALAAPEIQPGGDVGQRLRSIDHLREQNAITAVEHAEQRRRIIGSV